MHFLSIRAMLNAWVIVFGVYALLKLAFFFLLRYPTRRKLLDNAYAGRAYATRREDAVLLVIAVLTGVGLLTQGAEPISFLGGLLVGGTLIQLYFHAYHAPVSGQAEAPEPRSPLKMMSYAIQAEPGRPWKEMLSFGLFVVVCIALHWMA